MLHNPIRSDMSRRYFSHLLVSCWLLLLPAALFSRNADSLYVAHDTLASSAFDYTSTSLSTGVQPAKATRIAPLPSSLKLKTQREIRNYIRPCLSLSFYSTGIRPVKGNVPVLNQRLEKYSFLQTSVSFYTPLWTHTRFAGKDSTDVNTFHLLFTVNALTDRPTFSGLKKQHELYKLGLGVRGIWAFKTKCIIFADVTPFATGDKYNEQATRRFRLGTTFVMNFMFSPKFSWRVGATKTFLWGNRYFLPMVGFRFGKLDGKCYFQLQFPRYAALTIQPSPKFTINIYSRAYGGLYNISNEDSLYFGGDSVIQYGYRGIANGVRFDFRPGPNFSCFISGGFDVRNHIRLFSYEVNQTNLGPLTPFYKAYPDGTIFLNAGISIRFGKAKRSQGNYLMYDVFDLNNQMDPGDNNNNPGNGDIRKAAEEKEMKNVQYKDVEDLVDETDLY